jgi:hypothetical protein
MVKTCFIRDLLENFQLIFFLEFLKNFLTKEKLENLQHSLSFPEQIKKLTDGLDLISAELKQKIRNDYPTLIKHSSNASK